MSDMVGLAENIAVLPREHCVAAGITTTPRHQHCQCRLVGLLTCRGPVIRDRLNTVGGM